MKPEEYALAYSRLIYDIIESVLIPEQLIEVRKRLDSLGLQAHHFQEVKNVRN